MELEQIKKEWNHGLSRVHKAEKLAEDNPKLFDMYVGEFNKICVNMSNLMDQYESAAGAKISDHEFENGFKLN